MGKRLATGGFHFPNIYSESKEEVVKLLSRGQIDLIDIARWSLADDFMAFVLKSKFLDFADQSYPNPRKKNLIPVWFLISCQLLMHTQGQNSYKALEALLHAGPILSRVGFNVVAPLGFNDKNKYERATPVHQDAVRKFFKDTDPQALRRWFANDLQHWFRARGIYDSRGIYVLDQTHVVVPDNLNYEDAVWMQVDENGHRYENFEELTSEQRKALPCHRCYTLSTLLHLNTEKNTSHIVDYEWGPGNGDELPQARIIIDRFFEHNEPGAMKLLIVDRGYVSGEFITDVKCAYLVDILIPLKTNMHQHQDAIALSKFPDASWMVIHAKGSVSENPLLSVRACTIDKICLWDECKVPLFTTVIESSSYNSEKRIEVTNNFVLASTRKFDTPKEVRDNYKLRSAIEEVFRQLKIPWNLAAFPSPDRALIEAHVSFTLITFCLFQIFLTQDQFADQAARMLSSIRREYPSLHDAVVLYAGDHFGIFGNKEYFNLITQLPSEAQTKITNYLNTLPNQF